MESCGIAVLSQSELIVMLLKQHQDLTIYCLAILTQHVQGNKVCWSLLSFLLISHLCLFRKKVLINILVRHSEWDSKVEITPTGVQIKLI